MLTDLFSSFDPGLSVVYCVSPYFFWVSMFSMTIFVSPVRFVESVRVKVVLGLIMGVVVNLVKSLKLNIFPGAAWILVSVYMLLLMVNLSGLFPWVFSLSSHIVFSLSLACPLWLMSVVAPLSMSFWKKVGGLIVGGLPAMLNGLVGVIELVSVIVRPLTLGVRLSANILAGHVVLSLIVSHFMGPLSVVSLVVLVVLVGFYLFEVAVCVVQAYVFVLLLGVYLGEAVNSEWRGTFCVGF